MYRLCIRFLLLTFVFGALLPAAQGESVANASLVLSMCEAIATKTAKILIELRDQLLVDYWKSAENIATYIKMKSDRAQAQGADTEEVAKCSRKFNQTVYSRREALREESDKNAKGHMQSLDAEMFQILEKELKPDTLEKYVNIVRGISDTVVTTAKNEVGSAFKSSVLSLKVSYSEASNCLRNLMIKFESISK